VGIYDVEAEARNSKPENEKVKELPARRETRERGEEEWERE
jgi:hypothetical protein